MKTKENWIFFVITLLAFILMCVSFYPSNYVFDISHFRAPLPLRSHNKAIKRDSDDDDVTENSWIMEMEKKYLKENERIQKVCKKFGHKLKDKSIGWFNHLWTDTRHKIVGCLNAKVGSTSWKSNFYHLLPEETRKMLEKKFEGFQKIPYYR